MGRAWLDDGNAIRAVPHAARFRTRRAVGRPVPIRTAVSRVTRSTYRRGAGGTCMHGRSRRPGAPVLVVPAHAAAPPIPAVPASTAIPGRRSTVELPRAPGERTTSPG